MQIANYQLHSIETGRFGLDGGAMFGIVPKVLWNKSNPADEANRIELGMRALLLVDEDKVILIDTGIGEYWPEKFSRIYAIDHTSFSLQMSLQKYSLSEADITHVILTHLHFDHVGGAVKKEGGDTIPRFPKATYYIQKKHFLHAENPNDKDRASFIAETFMPLKESGKLEMLDGPGELFAGIEMIIVEGHTVGQQIVKISDSENTLLYCADLIPTSSHVPLPYVMAYDLYPVTTIREKQLYLPQAAQEQWLLYFEHDPSVAVATVKEMEKGFVVDRKKFFL